MKNIVCFGDSNTHGYDAETGGRFLYDIRWTGRLQALLGSSYHIIEEGLSGRTTVFEDPLFEGLNGLTAITPCLLTHEPVDLLIIMLGTNDTKGRFACNSGNIAKGLARLIHKAQTTRDAWQDSPNILILCPPPIESAYASSSVGAEMGAGCDVKSLELPSLFEETARMYGCHYLNAGLLPGMEMNKVDFMHLTAAGHEILAQGLAALLPNMIRA